jgi:curved DNA-binding protein CbpA
VAAGHSTTNTHPPGFEPFAEEQDYYRLLGVKTTADRQEITRAYRAAMKLAHPDRRHPDERARAEDHAKLLNRAFRTLTNPQERQKYDGELKAKLIQSELMSQYFGGMGLPGQPDRFGDRLRREQTPHERAEQRQGHRNAIASIVVVFGGITVLILLLLVIWVIGDFVLNQLR